MPKRLKFYFHKGFDVITVLGCEFKGEEAGKETKLRVKHGVKLYKKWLAKKIIMSGGTYSKKSLAYYMKKYAIKLGVPSKDIFIEEKSKDTKGNALFSKEIVKKNKWRNILVVSSDYHLERALFIFHQVYGGNYTIVGSDVKTSFFSKLSNNRFNKERNEYAIEKLFFGGVKEGDYREIRKRLLKTPKYFGK